jgi:glyoxylase-like metal-dependent hydrolase (beta-lactamase superfamily II)
MTRPDRGDDKHIYQYAGYKERDGIHFATETYVTRGGNPSFVTTYRSIDFNEDINAAFVLPEGYGPEAPALDFPDMTVEQVGDGIYLAGQNWGFSLFIDAGDHYIATGGYAGLKERLKAVQTFAGNQKPLRYQIVSHHHWDHVGGMTEAAELGANFIITKEHIETVRDRAAIDIPDERFNVVEVEKSISNGLVHVLDLPNEHSSHNLLTYVPSANLIFSADLFLSRQVSGAPDGYEDLRRLKAAISKAGFDVKRFAAAHSGRILTADDLNASINKISENRCPAGWVQCTE